MEKIFDLVVIGSGPGGLKAAIQAAKLGKRVAIVEKNKLGGSSVHTGTVPSKSLREAALTNRKSGFPAAVERMRKIISSEAKVIAAQLKRNKVEIFTGTAKFTGPTRIEINNKTALEGRHFVIATGTRPIRSGEFPFRLAGMHDSDSILSLKKLPSSLLVIGAGVIGCEYASIFAKLGSKVTLADRRSELLRAVDPEVITSLQAEFSGLGIELALGCEFSEISANGSANLSLLLNGRRRKFGAILACMGRSPNTDRLGLEIAGVATDERGYVKADRETFQTTAPHIYAVGDVIGPPGLAAASAEQGRIAACRIFQEPCHPFPASFPFGIYTIPEISMVGLQEAEIRERNVQYVVGRAPFGELARGLIVGDKNGFIKIFVNRENRQLLGVHAIGLGASELIHIGQAVMALKAPVDFLVDNVFNYPTFAEAYKVAALHAMNQIKS